MSEQINKPTIGEIRQAREIRSDVPKSQRYQRYIWHKCPDCGLERWVLLKEGKPQSDRCHPCGLKAMGLKQREKTWVTVICETCESPFQVEPHRKDTARFCSRKCRKTGRYIPCANCGNEVYTGKCIERTYKNRFCSVGCADDFRSKMPAEQHPRFISRGDIEDFSPEQKELIIGTVLGDASILKNSEGNAHLSVAHGEKQLDYITHKHALLQPLSRPVKHHDQFDKRYNKTYRTYRFFVGCHPYLTDLHYLFYGPNGKELPESIMENLTARSLAYWFFDDGSRHKGSKGHESCALQIATLSFPTEQVKRACEIIKAKFDIDCYPQKRGDIYISAYSIDRVKELLEPFIIPSMRYKLP